MTISYTLPCHSRQDDLLTVLPSVVASANRSPCVQIVVVDYGAKDAPLEPVLAPHCATLVKGNRLDVPTHRGRDTFHMAHARNIGIRACTGDYVVIASADGSLAPDYFAAVRQRIEETDAPSWLMSDCKGGQPFVVRRDELIAAGGFDERFELYGPEDRELSERLWRRGAPARYPVGMATWILTPYRRRRQGYRLDMSHREMYRRHGMRVYMDNTARKAIVVNEGLDWGRA